MVLAAFKLQQIRPDLEEIRLILAKAVNHGSQGAIYFNLMLEELSSEGFSENEVLSSFRELFN